MLALDTIELILQVMVVAFVGTAAFSAVWLVYIKWLGLREWWRELARPKGRQSGAYNLVSQRTATNLNQSRGGVDRQRQRGDYIRLEDLQQLRQQQGSPGSFPAHSKGFDEAAYKAFLEEMEGGRPS